MIIDTEKLKQGDAILVIKDKNGKLHSFGGSATSIKVVKKGVFTEGILGEKDSYEGTTEIGLVINERY